MDDDLAEIRGAIADASFGIYRSLQVTGCLGDFNPCTRVATERVARSHLADLLMRVGVLVPGCDSEDNSPWSGESRTYGVRYGCCNCHRSFIAKFTFGESAPDKGAKCPTCGAYSTVKKWPDC